MKDAGAFMCWSFRFSMGGMLMLKSKSIGSLTELYVIDIFS